MEEWRFKDTGHVKESEVRISLDPERNVELNIFKIS